MLSSLWASEQYRETKLGFRVKNILFKQRSNYQMVEILETFDWGNILMLDGLMMVTEKDEFFYHETIVHLPMALRPNIKNVMVVGGGDGGTVRELVKYGSIENIDMVEIDQLVVEACKKHLPITSSKLDDKRVKLIFQDAFEFIKSAPKNHYDLIIADSSDPEGFAASLIETDFYSMVKDSLKEDGLFAAQSGSPLSQQKELKATWSNLSKVFPHREIAWSITPTYPGAWWSFVVASGKEITKPPIQEINSPKDCKFWKPEMLEALLCKPKFIEDILESKS